MKKIILVLVITIGVLFTGCQEKAVVCVNDENILVEFTTESDMYKGIDIGALNKCNQELDSDEVLLERFTNFFKDIHESEFVESEDKNPYEQKDAYKEILEERVLTSTDIVDYNAFSSIDRSDDLLISELYMYFDFLSIYFDEVTESDTNITSMRNDDTDLELDIYANEDYMYSNLLLTVADNNVQQSQVRVSYENNHLILDNLFVQVNEGYERITYKLFEENTKLIILESESNFTGSKLYNNTKYVEIDLQNNTVESIKYQNVYPSIEYMYLSQENQEKLFFKNSVFAESTLTYTNIVYDKFINNEFVVGTAVNLKNLFGSGVDSEVRYNLQRTNYNFKYLTGWDYIEKASRWDDLLQVGRDNELIKTYYAPNYDSDDEIKYAAATMQFSNRGDFLERFIDNSQEFQLNVEYASFNQENFQNPLGEFEFDAFSYNDIITSLERVKILSMGKYGVSSNSIRIDKNEYSLEDITSMVELFIPNSFYIFYTEKSNFIENE